MGKPALKLRIGIFSAAHLHAESYIHNIRAAQDVDFIGIADDMPQRGEKFAHRYLASLYPSFEALLEQHLDGVIVCSENANHLPLVKLAAEAGVHVLCEKPLATRVQDARDMVETCDRAGVMLMTAFPMRFSAPIIEVYKLINAGKLGAVLGINATNQGECPKHHRAWFVDKHLAGGGAITDHTVHAADLLRWYLQDEVSEVFATANHILYADAAPEVETGGIVSLQFSKGTFANIDCSWSKPPYYPTWGGLTLDIVATNGFVSVNAFKQVLTVYTHAQQRSSYAYWGSDANQSMLNEFFSAIRAQRQPSVSGKDGLKAVEIVDAAYQSIDKQRPIPLPR